MSSVDVAILDLGIGNLLSVQRALEYLGLKVLITNDPDLIVMQQKIILPGVGSFSEGIKSIRKNNIDEALIDSVKKGASVLGICLGMQMLFESSNEFEVNYGLGFIEGIVEKIPNVNKYGENLKVPHIGWASLQKNQSAKSAEFLLKNIKENSFFYFTHSFAAKPKHDINIISKCEYGGYLLTAIASSDNVIGCQFHPEKSGLPGLKVLENFCEN